MSGTLERAGNAIAWRARRLRTRVANFGTARTCPMCAASVKAFGPEGEEHAVLFDLEVVGGGLRDGAICPVCLSVDRERLVYLFLVQRGLVAPGMRMMHVAPEAMLMAWLRKRVGAGYFTADLMQPTVDQNLDLTAIPHPEASLDAVICNHIMEHIPDDGLAMREVLRVLKPGGWAIAQVPIALKLDATIEDPSVEDPAERQRRFGQDDHIRIYTAKDYMARLSAAGFEIEPFRWTEAGAAYGAPENKYGLLTKEVLFFLRKPEAASA